MPPDLRNHLDPTGIDTPTSAAASSLDRPNAIAAQNPATSSRRATGGRPGDDSFPRPARSERRLFIAIATSIQERCDDRLRPPIIAAHIIVFGSPLLGQEWEYRYLTAESETQLSVCTAGVHYSDGPMLLRLYGEKMDFYFADDSLSLPGDTVLGNVVLEFKDREFVVVAATSPVDAGKSVGGLFLTPENGDYGDMLQSLRFGDQLKVVFPDGRSYSITLAGSNSALREAFECWSNNSTGAPFSGQNPFLGSSGTNPFQQE